MTIEVWISTNGKISEVTRTNIQEAIEAEDSKDTPSCGTEDLEILRRQGTETGLLGPGITYSPGAVYTTDGSNDKGVMGPGFYRLDENRKGCCQLGRGEKRKLSHQSELRI